MELKKNNKFYQFNKNSSLKEFIRVYENLIPDDFCDFILQEYENGPWKKTVDSGNTRTCSTVPLSIENVWETGNYDKRKQIDKRLFEYTKTVVNLYSSEYEYFICNKDSGYDLLKYSETEYCLEHIDSSYVQEYRSLSCSILLNDDFEGGEFCFFKKDLKYKLKKGSVLVFPSNYLYPHEVLPITKGIRYSIITWFF